MYPKASYRASKQGEQSNKGKQGPSQGWGRLAWWLLPPLFLHAFAATSAMAQDTAASTAADVISDVAAEGSTAAATTVIFSYPTHTKSVNGTEFPILVLANAETGEEVRLRREKKMQVLSVPAGRYYLRQILPGFFSFPSQPQKMPTSDDGFLNLPAATVAYLGDVSWSTDTGLRFGFSKEGLLALQKNTEFHDTPLVLAAFGREPRSVSWD